MSKQKLLILGDDPRSSTGFATVIREIIKRLSVTDEYEIWHIGWGNKIPTVIAKNTISLNVKNIDALKPWIKRITPDKIFMLHSYWGVRVLQRMPYVTDKILFYLVVDIPPVPKGMQKVLQSLPRIITPCKYSQTILSEADIDSGIVPHGVDTKVFRPIENVNPPDDKFVYLFLQKNNIRKFPTRLIESFARVDLDKKLLFMCTEKSRVQETVIPETANEVLMRGGDLTEVIRRFGIEDKVRWHELMGIGAPVPYEELPYIYNQSHVMVYSGSGESGALPTLEALACDIPVISTSIGVNTEYIKDRETGYLIDYSEKITSSLGDFRLIDISELSYKMKNISYQDIYEKFKGKCRKSVLKYDWDKVFPKFKKELDIL
jgi:glycosyltransferase involved in cell wall biosynthesis